MSLVTDSLWAVCRALSICHSVTLLFICHAVISPIFLVSRTGLIYFEMTYLLENDGG